MGKRLSPKVAGRLKRKKRVRKKVFGSRERPRLSVFRSARHIYAQVIDDTEGVTVAAASSLSQDVRAQGPAESKVEAARRVGLLVAKKAGEKGIEQVVFDRSGYLYHGRVKALADAAREGGLKF